MKSLLGLLTFLDCCFAPFSFGRCPGIQSVPLQRQIQHHVLSGVTRSQTAYNDRLESSTGPCIAHDATVLQSRCSRPVFLSMWLFYTAPLNKKKNFVTYIRKCKHICVTDKDIICLYDVVYSPYTCPKVLVCFVSFYSRTRSKVK